MVWIGDIETDGLYNECTKIHCGVFYNMDTEEWRVFTPDNITALSGFLNSIKSLCMHNGIGFDLRVFDKLLGLKFKGYYIDSLIMCRVLWPDMEKATYQDGCIEVTKSPATCDPETGEITPAIIEQKPIIKTAKGVHSVEAWGVRFGIKKPEHEDWSQYSEEMLHRCTEDVKIQTQLYLKCISEINKFKTRDPRLNNWKEIFKLEMDFWAGMEQQASNGWLLDIDNTYKFMKHLQQQINEIDFKLKEMLPKVIKYPYKYKHCVAFKKDGEITTNALKWMIETNSYERDLCGDFSRVKFDTLNLNSPAQLKDFLFSKGWVPREYNFKKDKHNKPVRDEKGQLILTTPKLPKTPEDWDLVANDTNSPELRLLANRSKIKHRLGLLTGLYENVRQDRRIEARMITCGTPTARATHICVVNIPKAKDTVFFGKECRSVFTVPEGKVLVGADASALEARCEAHYLYKIDRSAALMLTEGDIHTLNADVWNVVRDLAKNGKYALTYGCSPNKLAATLFKPPEMAKQLYNDFWDANPALKELVRLLEEQLNSRGYLVSIDGRPLSIRYKHARLNTLLQSAGAIVMKKAWCLFDEWRAKEGLQKEAIDVGNFHDELQVETLPELGETVGKQIVKSIEIAGEILRFNVPLTGEYKIGKNWAQTH